MQLRLLSRRNEAPRLFKLQVTGHFHYDFIWLLKHLKVFCVFKYRYLSDMGPLHLRIIKNKGLRIESPLECRIEEYKNFLNREGIIIDGERIIAGARGKEIALITLRPETLQKKCRRAGVQFKLDDVIVVIDMLKKVEGEINEQNRTPEGYTDYQRNNKGNFMQRTILLSKIILPALIEGGNRGDMIQSDLLGPLERINGLDVFRLKTKDVEMLCERENDLFPVTD